jgi:predicted ATPase/DNA-binding SARP family transcriptional activator/DNA-binding CsgD family transcriptional regulator
VWLLGGFRVSVGATTIGDEKWRRRKAASLVKLLALAPGYQLHREQVMDLLWPHLGRGAASNNLHQILHAARRTLEPSAPPSSSVDASSSYLLLRDEQLTLCPDSLLWVDVEAFEEATVTARHAMEPAAFRAAIDLYAGELLPEDRYEPWVEQGRAQLKELYLSLLLELAALYEEREEFREAIEALGRAVAQDPTHEGAHLELMRLHALSGRQREALGQYERLREALYEEFGREPDAATTRLHQEIWTGTFPHLSDSPPAGFPSVEKAPSPAGATRHNLPLARTSFIGRERETLELKRLLTMTKLLTLTGAGGCGKTRLALKVASDLAGAYPEGVWLVDLAPLSEAELVEQAVAQALGVREQPGRALLETLKDTLRTKMTLLVVDNCEHLMEAVVGLVDALLDSCPKLRVLATSRQMLNVPGEVNWTVPSLTVPGSRQEAYTPGELEAYESVRLFVDRANQRDPSFESTSSNVQAVAQVCRRLDGIPLAIELAAGRMGMLSAEQLASRLEDFLKLLTGGRTVVPRHRTLRATLAWSHELLSESERVLFRRLSVFDGGWTLDAAEGVCWGEGVEQGDVLEVLSELVERSLVVAWAREEGVPRFRMLEPVRQYGRERLEESGEAETAKCSHARYFLSFAEEAEPELLGPRETQWYDRLEGEHDNIRAALSWSLEGADPELGLRLAGAIWWFWHRHGHLSEGLRWLDEGLAKGSGASAMARAKALGGIGWLASGQGDLDRMQESATEGLSLGTQADLGGQYKALFLGVLGDVSRLEGDYERAMKLAYESLALSREANDLGAMANSLLLLGTASLWGPGDLEQARAYYEEGLAISRELGSGSILRSCLNSVALTYLLQRQREQAKALAEEATALCQEAGDRTLLPLPLFILGWVALLGGDLDQAEALHKESLALSKEVGGSWGTPAFLEGLACGARAKGVAERAAKLFGAAEGLREAMGVPLEPALRELEEPYVVGARSQLEESVWTEAWEEGRRMSVEAAIEDALSEEIAHKPPTLVAVPEQPPPPADEPTERLTSREQEVALLAARGLTNRRIALELSISEHTVANHVRNILKKLGLRSRTQISS